MANDGGPLRRWLAAQDGPVTYASVMRALAIPYMNILMQELETMMKSPRPARPLLAARVISRSHPLPNRGFFDMARALG